MAINIQYVANLNNTQVLQALKQINQNIVNLNNQASQNFGNVGKSAQASGAQIGAMAGVVGAVTTAFIQLGQQAIGTLVSIAEQGVQTAIQMDTLKARLGGIFDGSKEAADEAFGFIQEKSRELGIDLSELAGAFLPKTESLAQFERVAKIATALARSDPEQGAIGARIALIEALSGTFTSIQRRFEIPKEDINRIKEAFDTEGMEGFLTTLEQVLAESGKSFDDLANTAQTSFDKLAITGEQLGGRIGVPIVESLEAAANKILEFIDANEDDLIVFADTIGRAIADVIDLIGGIDLSQFDTGQLIQIADYIINVVNAVRLAVDQFSQLATSISPVLDIFSSLNPVFDLGYQAITRLDEALVTLSQIVALATASFEAIKVSVETVIEPLESLYDAVNKAANGDFAGATAELAEAQKELETALYDTTIPQKAFNESLLESQAAFDEYQASIDENKTAQDDLRQSLDETATAGTDAADSILAAGAAERQAAEDAEALAGAQAKVNEAMAEAQKDHTRKLEDIDIAAERKRLDIAIEFAQKREDAAQDHLDKITDIRKKNSQDIDDAATDLERNEEDIARKFADSRIDLEKEQRQKRLDIETDYRKKLQDIQSQFLLDAEDAERSRDAVGFLKAMRERDQKVSEAQVDRTREIDETRITGQQKLDELRLQREREIEEARIANERKLEDLALNLDRQIEAQNTAYARQLDDLATGEARKNEEAARKREEDIEDANRAYDRKLEDLKLSLAEELAIIAQGNAALEAEAARHNAAMEGQSNSTSSSRSQRPSTTGGDSAGFGDTPDSIGSNRNRTYNSSNFQSGGSIGGAGAGRPSRSSTRRAFGGLVNAGQSYPVGERGPELFTPSSNGKITPNSSLVMPSFTPKSNVNSISSSRNQEINLPMVNGSQLLDAVFIAKLRNIIRSELEGLL